jgi:cytosine/adenosine deaminase-related metal-dependent hydrolase
MAQDFSEHPQTNTTPFYQQLYQRIDELGGMFNAHLHLDRAGTLDDYYWQESGIRMADISSVALLDKHAMIKTLHTGPAYQVNNLKQRVNAYLDTMVAVNTFRADTFVDVTPDNVGLDALEALLEIKKERAGQIDLRLGAYSPMGYTDKEPHRWELLRRGAERADFIGSLPEADDTDDYPDHIGFYEHCCRMLKLGQEMSREIHVHVDQRNESSETGTEQLVRAVKECGSPDLGNGEPSVWAVHVISPSTYEEDRFQNLLAEMAQHNIGVIVCPSAALGMRQLRPVLTPTFNCIARVLEMLAAGIQVRIGSDNMADICSPSTTANMIDELYLLSAALRFYNVDILARLAAGQKLNEGERQFVINHLQKDQAEVSRVIDAINRRS